LGGELVEVAAHRLGGDVEVDRELGDGHAAARLEQLEDAAPAFTGVHGAPASSEVGRGTVAARGRGPPLGMRAPYARKPQRTTVTVTLFLWGEAARARGESARGVSEPSTPRRNDDPAGPDAAREPGLPPTGTALAMTIIGVLTLGTIASAVSGVARGIRWLSNIDMALGL